MEGFVEIEVHESCLCLEDEADVTYEFDAPMFFDFTKPESFLDDCEAEQWFEIATSYPPSPFVSKLKWGNGGDIENENGCVDPQQVSTMEENDGRGVKNCYKKSQDTLDGKVKTLNRSSSAKSKVFTFMKPTASHLAKLKSPPEVQTSQHFRSRNQEKSSSSIDCPLTKRQKLEAGYLRKAAHLKHQTLLIHKKNKEVDRADANLASKPNATVPREPNLQTALRAQRHKSRTITESGEHTKSGFQVPKARSLTKKGGGTLNTSSISNSDIRTSSRQENCRMISKLRASTDDKKLASKGERGVFRNIKVFPLEENDKRFQDEPPTELLSKLSLTSEAKQTAKSQTMDKSISKSSKENRCESPRQEHEMMNLVKEEIQRLCGKQYQCAQEMGSLVTMQTCKLEVGH